MSDSSTKKMLAAYIESQPASLFFTNMFQTKFYSSQKVEIDIVRSEEDVAIVVSDMSTGSRMNSGDIYTSKEFLAPAYDEAIPLNVFDLLERTPGDDPFADINFQTTATLRMFRGMELIERKIRRAVELLSKCCGSCPLFFMQACKEVVLIYK